MIPETGSDHSLRIYRCKKFSRPSGSWRSALPWTPNSAIRFWSTAPPNELTLLCSETLPENQLWVRYRRYTLRRAEAPVGTVPGAQADAAPAPGRPLCPAAG